MADTEKKKYEKPEVYSENLIADVLRAQTCSDGSFAFGWNAAGSCMCYLCVESSGFTC